MASTQAPTVAVVIVNANAGELLDRALASLRHQTLAPRRIVVVDNASEDGSATGLESRHPGVEVIRLGRNSGFAEANNVGVAAAPDCDWIALLNPDAFPEPRWLEHLLEAARSHPEYSFFCSRLVKALAPNELDGTGDLLHVSGFAWRRDHGRSVDEGAQATEEVFSACAAAALYRRDAFIGVGGFDESYFCYYEDSDLSFRLRLAGHRCLYVPDAVVHHVGSAIAGRESDFAVYHSYRNLVWTYVKNMPRPLLARSLPHYLLMTFLIVVAYTLRGRGRLIFSAQRDAFRQLPRVLRQRREIQAGRAVGSHELRRVLATGASAYTAAFGRAWEHWFRREVTPA